MYPDRVSRQKYNPTVLTGNIIKARSKKFKKMIIRPAIIDDIKQIQIVRNSVKENTLSDPNFVTDEDCADFICHRGKGWVCEIATRIVGFAIADLKDHNIWALFLDPEFEKRGIGQQLHKVMLDWYFSQTKHTVWLGTAFDTRAERFYRAAGWTAVGLNGSKEIKFEMTYEKWANFNKI